MEVSNISNINFKGYNNIHMAVNLREGNTNISYLAMQLYDDEENKDLSTLKKLHEMRGRNPDANGSDVLVLTHITDEKNNEFLLLDTDKLHTGDDLLVLEKSYKKYGLTFEEYKHFEKWHMKAYTLLAGLTTRIKDSDITKSSSLITKVCDKIFETELRIFSNNNALAFNLVKFGFQNGANPKDMAKAINKGIEKSLEKFFK